MDGQPTAFASSAARPPAAADPPDVNFNFGLIEFPRSPDTTATGLNSRGDVVGLYGLNLPAYEATEQSYLLEGNTFQELIYQAPPTQVDSGSTRAGRSWLVFRAGNVHAFLRKGKEYTKIDYPGSDIPWPPTSTMREKSFGIRYQNTGGSPRLRVGKRGLRDHRPAKFCLHRAAGHQFCRNYCRRL